MKPRLCSFKRDVLRIVPASRWLGVGAAVLLAACATPEAPLQSAGAQPARWYAPVPTAAAHGGEPAELARWWAQFGDPALDRLMAAAQARNGSVEQAAARIAQARAELRAAGSSALPGVDASGMVQRGRSNTGVLSTTGNASVDMSWEVDLWGGVQAGRSASLAQLQASEAAWHDARVSVAAETAQNYIRLRRCEQQHAVQLDDAQSLQRSAELTRQKVVAGLEAPANGALLQASAAQSAAAAVALEAQCESIVKSLVALTGVAEEELRPALADTTGRLPQPRAFTVDLVPADLLARRPDLRQLERQAAAALKEVDVAEAERWPRLSLTGSIGRTRVSGAASALVFEGTTWSIGPSLNIPLFDGQRRSAAVESARARYQEAGSRYAQRARDAVREVETALVDLDAARRRQANAEVALQGYDSFLTAQRARAESGAASLLELEESRRTALSARYALIGIQADRVLAWVDLYRAVGGGWSGGDAVPADGVAAMARER